MTQEAMNNAIVLFKLGIERKDVEEAERILNLTSELKEVFNNPTIQYRKKQMLVEDIFGKEDLPVNLINFLKVLCRNHAIGELDQIIEYYYQYWDEKNKVLNVTLAFASALDKDERNNIDQFLESKYPGMQIKLKEENRPELLGGFVLYAGLEEYDWSYEGSLKQLERKLTGR